MKKKKGTPFDSDALLRFSSGESSLDEIAVIVNKCSKDHDLSQMISLLDEIRADGLLCEHDCIPLDNIAAASEGNLCDIQCEQHILKEYYPEEDVADTLDVALDNAWIKETGTPLYNAGRLLEKYGWPVKRGFDHTMDELAAELGNKRHAIAIVDSGALWENAPNGMLHAVIVLSAKKSGVRIWDPAIDGNADYSAEEFETAWSESRHYLVIASSGIMEYIPRPVDVSSVELDSSLIELGEAIAENVHDVWSKARIEEGWTYGEHRDDKLKLNPDLVPYAQLPDTEKNYDRNSAFDTLRLVRLLGFEIKRKRTNYCQACGRFIESDFSFCPYCGTKLEHD